MYNNFAKNEKGFGIDVISWDVLKGKNGEVASKFAFIKRISLTFHRRQ